MRLAASSASMSREHANDVELESQVRGRAGEALEVVLAREGHPAVQPQHLEDAVAAQQPSSVTGIRASASGTSSPSTQATLTCCTVMDAALRTRLEAAGSNRPARDAAPDASARPPAGSL